MTFQNPDIWILPQILTIFVTLFLICLILIAVLTVAGRVKTQLFTITLVAAGIMFGGCFASLLHMVSISDAKGLSVVEQNLKAKYDIDGLQEDLLADGFVPDIAKPQPLTVIVDGEPMEYIFEQKLDTFEPTLSDVPDEEDDFDSVPAEELLKSSR